tara:strand:- start:51 stop:245 length:195 start_codon:yes stop_codon:yes gene_type:complete
MDTILALMELGVEHNEFRLTKSDAPNSIFKWIGPDPEPTQEQLEAGWALFLEKNPDWIPNAPLP